jgi:hypothetical protein
MINNGYDATLSAQLGGFDPFMLMGLSTMGMMAVGWLIGPIFGNQVFNLAYRGVLGEFTRVCHVSSWDERDVDTDAVCRKTPPSSTESSATVSILPHPR